MKRENIVKVVELIEEITRYSNKGPNLMVTCPFAKWAHGKGRDSRPSCGILVVDDDESVYNCFHGSTRIITYEGVRAIGELVGTTPILLDGAGNWTPSPIHHFGKQRLWRIELSRNGVKKEIFATGGHRWSISRWARPYSPEIEVTTKELREGHRIPSVFGGRPVAKLTSISPFGVAHGFVYGDGTQIEGSSIAYFNPPKDQGLIRYFNGLAPFDRGDGVLQISSLPKFFRRLPDLNEASSYLLGWLAGYFAADGCVDERGTASMASASREALEGVQRVCMRLGVATYGIRSTMRTGYGTEPTPLYSLTFLGSSLPSNFFLLPHHRERFDRRKESRFERTGWVVKSVKETDWVDDVFCPTVPTTHSFVLEDNVKTLNCFACGMRGSLHSMVAELNFRTEGKYEELEEQVFELETVDWGNVAEKASRSVHDRLDSSRQEHRHARALESDRNEVKNENELDAWRGSVPRYAIERGFTIETCKAWELGHARDEKRLVFPFRRAKDRALVGVTGRSYVNAEPKYLDLIPFAKAKYLYGEWMVRADAKRIVIVEGQPDVIVCWQAGESALGISGSFASTEQTRKIVYLAMDEGNEKPVYLFPDGDHAGKKWANRLGQDLLEEGVHVYDAWPGEETDPSDLTCAQIPKVLDAARFRI